MILIEPQWNVDEHIKELKEKCWVILIEPQWNVDTDEEIQVEEVKDFNRTIVECRSIYQTYR